MKLMLIFFVSIVVLCGCDYKMRPAITESEGCFDYYRAVLAIQYENGDPCLDASAMMQDGIGYSLQAFDYLVDSTGLKIKTALKCNKYNTQTRNFLITVYYDSYIDDAHKTDVIYFGSIDMVKFENWLDDNWPDPIIEIIVPDSLLQ